MDFMKKEDRERVKIFNQVLGTKHRTKPYDWNKAEDIIEAVTMTTAEFVDITHMDAALAELDSDLDQMIECYHPNEWTKITTGDTWDHFELQEAMHTLTTASDAMQDLANVAEEDMQEMLSLLFFRASQTVRDYFFTPGWQFDAKIAKQVIAEELCDIALDMEYDGVIPHSAGNFTKALEQRIKHWRPRS